MTLRRTIEITDVKLWSSVSAQKSRGKEPELHEDASIDLTGTMNEPIRHTTVAQIAISAVDKTTLGLTPQPWVGLVNQISPTVNISVLVAHRHFDRLWQLALADKLKYAHIMLTKPSSHRADVSYLSFATNPESDFSSPVE